MLHSITHIDTSQKTVTCKINKKLRSREISFAVFSSQFSI